MKQSLLSMLCIVSFCLSITAQITINRTDFALTNATRDSSLAKLMTKTGAVLPSFGNNQTWDYTALKDSVPNIAKTYYEPVGTFGTPPALLSDATEAWNYTAPFQIFPIPSRAYMKLDATGYAQIGYASNGGRFSLTTISGGATDSLIFPAYVTRFTSPWTVYKFPMTANSVWKSVFRDTTNFQITVGLFSLNKTPGSRVSFQNQVDTIIGWGTLKMKNPSGGTALSYAVLLNRETLTNVDSFFVGGAPAPAALLGAFGLTQGSVGGIPAYYEFLGIGFKHPFMSISTNASGAITNIYRAVLPTLGLTTHNRETADYAVATSVYPNPTTEGVNIAFQKTNAADWNVMIYNSLGQIISINRVSAPQGSVNQRIALASSLPSGTYFYNLLDETSLIRANGKVLLNR